MHVLVYQCSRIVHFYSPFFFFFIVVGVGLILVVDIWRKGNFVVS